MVYSVGPIDQIMLHLHMAITNVLRTIDDYHWFRPDTLDCVFGNWSGTQTINDPGIFIGIGIYDDIYTDVSSP